MGGYGECGRGEEANEGCEAKVSGEFSTGGFTIGQPCRL